jgi:SAM-dependent methyltransferase
MSKRQRFVSRHRPGGRLLDVGCATGLFLRAMRASGVWTVQGVEVDPQAASIARDRYHLDVYTGTLEQAALPGEAFDAITLWDVLEHLHDPAASLGELHRLLKPGGVLVVRVPNGASWDARLFGQYWAGLEPPRHLYVFTAVTLRQFIERAGLAVVEFSSASAAYITFLLSLKFYLRERGGRLARRLFPLLYHPVMRLLSAPLFGLASLGLRGPQLVAVARRRGAHA